MFAPVSPEPEWIELWNISQDTLDISGWSVVVGHYNPRFIPKGSSRVAPDSMMILTSKDSLLAAIRRIPRNKIIYVPINQLSNSGSSISLRDTSGNLIDSLTYDGSWISKSGISIERIDERASGSDAANWKACEDTSRTTILRPNSVRRLEHDLALSTLVVTDSSVQIEIINRGRDTAFAPSAKLLVGVDTIAWVSMQPIAPNDSIVAFFSLPNDFYGTFDALAHSCDPTDERHSNDTVHVPLHRSIPQDSLLINEIMFDPSDSDCQWIELFNTTSRIISLDSTRLLTGSSRPAIYSFVLPSFQVKPNNYAIIAANDSFVHVHPGLDRSATLSLGRSSLDLGKDSCYVVLDNGDGSMIDSLHYYGSWQQSLVRNNFTGISLERKQVDKRSNDATNWQASHADSGSTPLAENSASTLAPSPDTITTTFNAHFSPNPFSPDGDGFEDESILTIQTTDNDEWALRARLFDDRGRVVRTLADVSSLYRSMAIPFDGRRDNGQLLNPGLYTALIEVTAHNPTRSLKQAIGIAIAGKRK